MIKEIKQLIKKYREIAKNYESISISEVINDLRYLEREARIKRLPKEER